MAGELRPSEAEADAETAENTTWRSTLADFRIDVARYVYYDDQVTKSTRLRLLRAFIANQGLQAVALYRFARLLRAKRSRGPMTTVLVFIGRLIYPFLVRLNDIVNGIWISPTARIGKGLYLAHAGGVIIGPVQIGENCNIGNSVTIGKSGRGDQEGVPIIGDRVVLSVGARVLGGITVGDDAMVGPGSVVLRDVPARAVVLGVPARQVGHNGSFDYISYPGMDDDVHRAQSRALVVGGT